MSAVSARKHAPSDSANLASAVAQRDWECLDADTRYLTHDIHRYSSKYIPQIAGHAIELLTQAHDVVLDPMVGSGTTLVEAWIRNRRAIGIDLNPLAGRIARVKTRRVEAEALDEAVAALTSVVNALDGQLQFGASPILETAAQAAAKDPRSQDVWFIKWFQPHVLRDLLIFDHAIRSFTDARVRDVAYVALSNILRRSSNAHSSYPNVMFNRKAPRKPAPGAIFLKTLHTYAERVKQLLRVDYTEPIVEIRDARTTGLADRSVDAIVSHPPYIGSVPYAEYGLLSLRWFGTDSQALDATLLGGKRQSRYVVDRFRTMYAEVLAEAQRVLRPGRHMFLMVGDPVVQGAVVDLASMTREFAASVGFIEVTATVRRGVNRRANKMAHETLLFFERPA